MRLALMYVWILADRIVPILLHFPSFTLYSTLYASVACISYIAPTMTPTLLNLPLEVRQMILGYCLINHESPFHLVYKNRVSLGGPLLESHNKFLSILRVNRQLHEEGSRIFFGRNVFIYGDYYVDGASITSKGSETYGPGAPDARICEHALQDRSDPCQCPGRPREYETEYGVVGATSPRTTQVCDNMRTEDFLGYLIPDCVHPRSSKGRRVHGSDISLS